MASPCSRVLTNCNNPAGACAAGEPVAFLAALHRRIVDRIAWPWARDWLACYAHLELAERAGWPVLLLILDSDPPPSVWPQLLHRQYSEAASTGKGTGPLADLAAAVEVAQ